MSSRLRKQKINLMGVYILCGFSIFILTGNLFGSGNQGGGDPVARQVKLLSVLPRPDAAGIKTRVNVGIVVLDVSRINNIEQTFTTDFIITIGWHDPRLKAEAGKQQQTTYTIDEIWHPYFSVFNERNLDGKYNDILRVDDGGNVQYLQRFIGELSSPLNLRNFPIDQQVLPITILSLRYGPDEVEFIPAKKKTTLRETLSIAGWTVTLDEPRVIREYYDVQDRYLSRIDFSMTVKRHSSYYFLKMLIPLGLIVFMAWSVFWIDPSLISVQIGIATASVFTLVMYQFRLGQLLPPVSYMTRMDLFVRGATIVVFLSLAETIFTSRLARRGKEELGRRIDRWGRWIYLILFLLIVLKSFII